MFTGVLPQQVGFDGLEFVRVGQGVKAEGVEHISGTVAFGMRHFWVEYTGLLAG